MLDKLELKLYMSGDQYAGNNIPLSPMALVDAQSQCIDTDEVIDYVNTFRKNSISSLSNIELNEVMSDYDNAIYYSEISIGENRVTKGFEAGLIDIINDAYRLTNEGWVNSSGAIVMPANVELNTFKDFIEYKCEVVPYLSRKDIDDANDSGIVKVNDKVIATKSDSIWKFTDTGRELSGDALRVLHHSNEKVIIGSEIVKGEMYHATVTPESELPEINGEFYGFDSRGISAQGDAFYMTKSQNEAIRVYGNPRSFERRGAPHSLNRPDLIGAVHRGTLHKFEVTNEANIYDATFDTNQPTFCMDSKPSAHLLKVIADEYGVSETMKGILVSKTLSMCNQGNSQFEVYLAVSEFATSVKESSGSSEAKNPLGRIFTALGYDGVEISEPNKNLISSLTELVNEIEGKKGDVYDTLIDNKLNPDSACRNIQSYLLKVKQSEITKMEKGHVIMFNANNDLLRLTETINLPMHMEFISPGAEDNFYNIEKGNIDKMTSEQIKALTKVSFSEYEQGVTLKAQDTGLSI